LTILRKVRAKQLTAVAVTVLVASPLAGQEPNMTRVIDFASDDAGDWVVVNDGVMGGRSASSLTGGKGEVAVFQGRLSLEDNGGFASVRRQIPAGTLEGASAVSLRVRGDGRPYQLRLRPDRRFDGIAYAADFGTTAGQWITVQIPLASFEPTFRGFRPPGVGPLDPSRVGQVGVMLADKQEGAFRLEIEWIGFD